MALTHTAIVTKINTLLADNTGGDIDEADLREVSKDILDFAQANAGGNASFLGFYTDEPALTTAHATASDGDYAILGSTDTVWAWDSDTTAWVDTGGAGSSTAAATTYDNSGGGLSATNVKTGLDELSAEKVEQPDIDQAISAIKEGVATEGDTLNKLYALTNNKLAKSELSAIGFGTNTAAWDYGNQSLVKSKATITTDLITSASNITNTEEVTYILTITNEVDITLANHDFQAEEIALIENVAWDSGTEILTISNGSGTRYLIMGTWDDVAGEFICNIQKK